MIKVPYNGSFIECDTPEEAAELLRLLPLAGPHSAVSAAAMFAAKPYQIPTSSTLVFASGAKHGWAALPIKTQQFVNTLLQHQSKEFDTAQIATWVGASGIQGVGPAKLSHTRALAAIGINLDQILARSTNNPSMWTVVRGDELGKLMMLKNQGG